MSKWLKLFLFVIWGVLLVPLIAAVLQIWLEENFFSESNAATTFFSNLVALGQQRWFRFALVLLTGVLIGTSLEWLTRKSDEKKLSSSEASVLNLAVFQIASKFGPLRQNGRAMCTILDLQSCLHLFPPRNLICGYQVTGSTNCRMRLSFVNISDVSEGF